MKLDIRVNAMRNGKDSVNFIMTGKDVPQDARSRRTISAEATSVLRILLENFENIACCTSPFEFWASDWVPDSINARNNELWSQDIVPWQWETALQFGEHMKIALRNDEYIEGTLIGATARRLILWTANGPFNRDSFDGNVFTIPHDSVRSILLDSYEHWTAGLFALAAWSILPSTPMTGYHLKDGGSLIVAKVFTLLLGLPAFLIPVQTTLRFDHDTENEVSFEDHDLSESTGMRWGVPPELLRYLNLPPSEPLINETGAALPYAEGTVDETDISQPSLKIGFDQIILRTNKAVDSRLLLSLESSIWPASVRNDYVAGGAVLRGGMNFLGSISIEGNIAGRVGPVELTAGLRYMHIANAIYYPNYGTSYEKHEIHPDNIWGECYSSFGVGVNIYSLQLRFQYLTQLSPSARIISDHSGPDMWGEFVRTSTADGIRVTAVTFSASLRLL
ncbi:hypothetical protein KQI65_15710 [bacterium]|nr:hypothetical protein [bacterium]